MNLFSPYQVVALCSSKQCWLQFSYLKNSDGIRTQDNILHLLQESHGKQQFRVCFFFPSDNCPQQWQKRRKKKNLRTIQEISSLFKLNGFQSNKHSVICFTTYRKDRKVHYSYAVMGFFLYYKILMEHFLLLISNT